VNLPARSALSREMARFQARSAFTCTGFTTAEAESVVQHPVRRRIVLGLMLAGNAGLAAVVASLMLGFTHGGAGSAGYRVLELLGGLVVLLALARSRWVDGRDRVSELVVEPGDWMAG